MAQQTKQAEDRLLKVRKDIERAQKAASKQYAEAEAAKVRTALIEHDLKKRQKELEEINTRIATNPEVATTYPADGLPKTNKKMAAQPVAPKTKPEQSTKAQAHIQTCPLCKGKAEGDCSKCGGMGNINVPDTPLDPQTPSKAEENQEPKKAKIQGKQTKGALNQQALPANKSGKKAKPTPVPQRATKSNEPQSSSSSDSSESSEDSETVQPQHNIWEHTATALLKRKNAKANISEDKRAQKPKKSK